jgi:hypothetical protein
LVKLSTSGLPEDMRDSLKWRNLHETQSEAWDQ